MSLLPKLDFDIGSKVEEFLKLLRSIDRKLDRLIELEEGRRLDPGIESRGTQ